MSFQPWMLAAIDQAGYNGIRQEHINAVAEEILNTGLTEVSYQTFDAACRRCGGGELPRYLRPRCGGGGGEPAPFGRAGWLR